ncbi:MAG: hypothetical protein R3E98_08285 [Gemmatimonadota bacterium]|nr:hypothetical protein [Gemmatimonadota bacterium]
MDVRRSAVWYLVVFLAAAVPRAAPAQLIPIRTVPVATGDPFLLTPSDRLGMGGLGLALEDTTGAPFSNPAASVRLAHGMFFTAPVHYRISDPFRVGSQGSGTSLPLGAFFRGSRWSGGGWLALQELTGADGDGGFPVPFFADCDQCRFVTQLPIGPTLGERSARNVHAHAQVARALEGRSAAWGVSASMADLGWMAGVEHLYAGSQRIDPSGTVWDLRAGLLWERPDGAVLEAVALHNRVDMTHRVTYVDWQVPTLPPDSVPANPVVVEPRIREEVNEDVTRTWGAHVRYARPLDAEGWRVGWVVTANRREHPKLPDYEIQNIPRDPGRSWAFDLGAGLARRSGPLEFGVEAVLEPISARTWQEAATDTTTVGGQVVRAGERTIDNQFDFLNVRLRSGVQLAWRRATVQAGVEARAIAYDLEQVDRLRATVRTQQESWMEWTPTWSVDVRVTDVRLRYTGLATTGTGRPGIADVWGFSDVPRATAASDGAISILPAPSGPLTLQSATVWTHQVALVVPIG